MTLQFNDAMNELDGSYLMRNNRRLSNSIGFVREEIQDITVSLTGRFESFDLNSRKMWDNITAESFAKVKQLIQTHHMTIGGVLCGLTAKMDNWLQRFGVGYRGMIKLAEFIMSDMIYGIERISGLEKSAPKIPTI